MKILINNTCFFSSILFFIAGLIKSSVKVELEVNTSEESVDIEADNTNTTIKPIKNSGSAVSSIAGMIASYSSLPLMTLIKTFPVSAESVVANNLPKPPKK